MSFIALSTVYAQKNDTQQIISKAKSNALIVPQIQVIPIKNTDTGQEYELYIELPENYAKNSSKKYPVLYYTDAGWHQEMLSGATEYLLEDVILVGISWQKNISEKLMKKFGTHASRFFDYSFWMGTKSNHFSIKFGQAENHLKFIRNKVMSYVEQNYRTDPNSKSYFGYSLSGAFGAYTLITQPDTFDNYILGSPLSKRLVSYLAEINSKRATNKSAESKKLHANVYMAYGSLEKDTEEPAREFFDLFKNRTDIRLSKQHEIIEGNHQTAFPRIAIESVAWLASMMTHISTDSNEISFWDIPHLNKAFISTTPEDRKDGIVVDTLSVSNKDKKAILNLSKELFDDKHGNYDALLISHKNKLVFESYYKKGRINVPHGQASATKGYTSLIIGRAIQMGYLSMEDLDKPIINFLKDVDPSKFTKGVEKITLHKALTMQGGLNIDREKWKEFEKDSVRLKGQGLVQTLLEQSAPITSESQTYLYGNFNPIMVMTVIDAVVPGTAEDFIKKEFLDKLGIDNYNWSKHASGLPNAGWGVKLLSRDMIKLGNLVLNKGKLNGEQLISEEYLAKATSGIVNPTQDWVPKDYHYGYFWYQTQVKVGHKNYDVRFAWGGGEQRVIVVEELDLTIVISGHDRNDALMTKVEEIVIPAFVKK